MNTTDHFISDLVPEILTFEESQHHATTTKATVKL